MRTTPRAAPPTSPPPLPFASLVRRCPPDLGISVGLAVVTLFAFAPAWGNDFLDYDDPVFVTANPHVRAGLTRDGLAWALTATESVSWHPLVWWSLQLDAELFGDDPAGYHGTNVLLHVGSAVLLFWALRLMTGARWPSAAAAALFAVHPLRAESVAWVAERKDTLATFFWMLGMFAYARYVRRPGPVRYLGVAASLAAGLAAKQTLLTFPFALLLLDYWPLGRLRRGHVRRVVVEKLPLVGLAVAAGVAALWAQRLSVRSAEQFPWDLRLGNALIAYVQYVGMFAWPVGLAAFYPHPRLGALSAAALGAAAVLALATAVAVRQARMRPYLLVGWLWYLGTLVPMIGLVQVGGHGRADRNTYIPSVGLTVLLVWGLAGLARRSPQWRAGLAWTGAVVIAGLSLVTRHQVGYWGDTERLWRHTLEAEPDNPEAHRNLAAALDRRGKRDEVVRHYEAALKAYPTPGVVETDLGAYWMRRGRYDLAEQYFRAAVRADPASPLPRNNLGGVLVARGHPAEAAAHLEAAATAMPDHPGARFNLALAYAALGRVDEAERAFAEGRRLQPDNAAAHHGFGTTLRDRGEPARAVPYLEAAVAAHPDQPELRYDLAVALQWADRLPAALDAYREAVRQSPADVRYLTGLAHALHAAGDTAGSTERYAEATRLDPEWADRADQQAWRLAVHPEAGQRNGARAVRLAEETCQATGFARADFVDTLAAAYAEADRFPEAVSTARRAAGLATDARLAAEIRDRLALYEGGRPFRARLAPEPGPPDSRR